MLVVHDPAITDEQHVRFTEGFGRLEMAIPNDPMGDGGPVGVLSNDGSFNRIPLRGSLLAAKVVPPEVGETEFASLCAAHVTLSEETKGEPGGTGRGTQPCAFPD